MVELMEKMLEANKQANPLIEREFVQGQVFQEKVPDSGLDGRFI